MNKRVIVFAFLFRAVVCQLQNELHANIGNMIGAEVNAGGLCSVTAQDGRFYTEEISIHNLASYLARQEVLPHVTWKVNPFERFKTLAYGGKSSVSTLIYYNQINAGGGGYVVAHALMGKRVGDTVKMASAYGIVTIAPAQQWNVVPVQQCHSSFFSKSCNWVWVPLPRGFYPNEIEAITSAIERQAAISMRNSLGLGDLVSAPEVGLGNGFNEEHLKLRTLYPEIEYEYTDVVMAEIANFDGVLHDSLKAQGEQHIKDRIRNLVRDTQHLNFIYVMSDKIVYYLIAHNHFDGHFDLHISQFTVGGTSSLPQGAFAVSAGSWSLELPGANANPSIHQILAIFGYK